MKFIRVFAPSYYGLRAQHPNAFAIRPTRSGGYEGVIEVKKSFVVGVDTLSK